MVKTDFSYEVIIGCEIHCQLLTKTKAFCSCENRYGGMANTRVCPVCLGLPGALPVVNREYVSLGVKAGHALGCTINHHSGFDRKHYFYPDLVKGYQITQYDVPLCAEGQVAVNMAEPHEEPRFKVVGIERIHLEEDVGKSLHIDGAYSYIDFNRSGVPLIEIVSKPDMTSPDEAARYMQTVREILRFIGVTEGNMEEGGLRCDANVNLKIMDNGVEFRTPIAEIKNMNSFKAVREACEYEVKRQLDEYNSPQRAAFAVGAKRTMNWDAVTGKTSVIRTKTAVIDYRFMREPDLPPLLLSKKYAADLLADVGELPEAKRARFKQDYGLSDFDVNTLTGTRELSEWFEAAVRTARDAKKTANWILAEVLAVLNEKNIGLSDLLFTPEDIGELVNAVDSKQISGKQAKTVFADMRKTGKKPHVIINEQGLQQVSDEAVIKQFVDTVFATNPQALNDWKNGKTNVEGWLKGQVMKMSKGQANPVSVAHLVRERLTEI